MKKVARVKLRLQMLRQRYPRVPFHPHRTWTLVLGPHLRGHHLLPFPWHLPWISFGGCPIFANTKTMLTNICFRESPPPTAIHISSSSVAASTIPVASISASATSLPSAAVAASSSSAPEMNTEDSLMCVNILLFIISNNCDMF